MFDELSLQRDIERVWGPAGAHADVYRSLLAEREDLGAFVAGVAETIGVTPPEHYSNEFALALLVLLEQVVLQRDLQEQLCTAYKARLADAHRAIKEHLEVYDSTSPGLQNNQRSGAWLEARRFERLRAALPPEER